MGDVIGLDLGPFLKEVRRCRVGVAKVKSHAYARLFQEASKRRNIAEERYKSRLHPF